MFRDGVLDSIRNIALDASRPVIGAHDQFIAGGAELVIPEDKLLVAKADDADYIRAALLEGARLRKDRRHAEAAADTQYLFALADDAGDTHWPDDGVQCRSQLAGLLHLAGRLAHRLYHDCNGAFVAVEVGDGQWDALAALVQHDDDELARPRRFG